MTAEPVSHRDMMREGHSSDIGLVIRVRNVMGLSDRLLGWGRRILPSITLSDSVHGLGQ
jgi:hypothetical protein